MKVCFGRNPPVLAIGDASVRQTARLIPNAEFVQQRLLNQAIRQRGPRRRHAGLGQPGVGHLITLGGVFARKRHSSASDSGVTALLAF